MLLVSLILISLWLRWFWYDHLSSVSAFCHLSICFLPYCLEDDGDTKTFLTALFTFSPASQHLWGQEVGILSCGIWCDDPGLPNYRLDSVVFASSYTELSLLCLLDSSDHETCITAGVQSSPACLRNLASKWTKTSDNWETLEGKTLMIIGIYWKSIESNKNPQITRV